MSMTNAGHALRKEKGEKMQVFAKNVECNYRLQIVLKMAESDRVICVVAALLKVMQLHEVDMKVIISVDSFLSHCP